jgi:hypothetical protein
MQSGNTTDTEGKGARGGCGWYQNLLQNLGRLFINLLPQGALEFL